VREDVEKFLEENPSFRRWMAALEDASWVVGPTLIVVDVLTTGGWLTTTIGPITVAGVGGSAMAAMIGKALLGRLGQRAHEAWVAQRSRELQSFLEKHFFERLFEPWLAEVRTVGLGDIESSLQAYEKLNQLVRATR